MNTWFNGKTPIASFDGSSVKPRLPYDGEANCTMPIDTLENELSSRGHIPVTVTPDGTFIISDLLTGISVSHSTREEAEAEVRRIKAGRA